MERNRAKDETTNRKGAWSASRRGGVMVCSNCGNSNHNAKGCKKPAKEKKQQKKGRNQLLIMKTLMWTQHGHRIIWTRGNSKHSRIQQSSISDIYPHAYPNTECTSAQQPAVHVQTLSI